MQPSSRRRLCVPADDLAAAGSGACAHGSNVARERCSIGTARGGRSPCRQQQPSAHSWQLRGRREADNRQHTCSSTMQQQLAAGVTQQASRMSLWLPAADGVFSPPPSDHPRDVAENGSGYSFGQVASRCVALASDQQGCSRLGISTGPYNSRDRQGLSTAPVTCLSAATSAALDVT